MIIMIRKILFFSALMLANIILASAQDETNSPIQTASNVPVGNFLYSLYDDNHAELTGTHEILSGDVIVPGSIEYNNATYKVTVVSGLSKLYIFNSDNGTYELAPTKWNYGIDLSDYALVSSINFSEGIEQITDGNIVYFNHCKVINIPKTVSFISPGTYRLPGIDSGYSDQDKAATIAPYVFAGANIKFNDITFSVSSENADYASVDGVLYDKDMKTLLRCPKSKEGVFVVPDGVEKIEGYAFHGCILLTGVRLPESVRSIGSSENPNYNGNCFYFCLMLKDINIPEGVERIEYYTFRSCCNLTTLTLPSTLKYFDSSAITGNGMKISKINWQNCSLETLLVNYPLSSPEMIISLPKSVKWIKKLEGDTYTPSLYSSECIIPETLIIPASLEVCEANLIGGSSTKWCEYLSPLKKIYAISETPLDINDGFFGYERKKVSTSNSMTTTAVTYEEVFPQSWADQCTLYVPINAVDVYKSHDVWGRFPNIEGLNQEDIDNVTVVRNVNTSIHAEDIDRVYSIGGKKISQPQKGLNIIRMRDGRTRKIVK